MRSMMGLCMGCDYNNASAALYRPHTTRELTLTVTLTLTLTLVLLTLTDPTILSLILSVLCTQTTPLLHGLAYSPTGLTVPPLPNSSETKPSTGSAAT